MSPRSALLILRTHVGYQAESEKCQLRRTQCEQMSSELPLKADIAQYSRHVSKVPILLQNSFGIAQYQFSGRTWGERIMI
jgi:hypothetical protein